MDLVCKLTFETAVFQWRDCKINKESNNSGCPCIFYCKPTIALAVFTSFTPLVFLLAFVLRHQLHSILSQDSVLRKPHSSFSVWQKIGRRIFLFSGYLPVVAGIALLQLTKWNRCVRCDRCGFKLFIPARRGKKRLITYWGGQTFTSVVGAPIYWLRRSTNDGVIKSQGRQSQTPCGRRFVDIQTYQRAHTADLRKQHTKNDKKSSKLSALQLVLNFIKILF